PVPGPGPSHPVPDRRFHRDDRRPERQERDPAAAVARADPPEREDLPGSGLQDPRRQPDRGPVQFEVVRRAGGRRPRPARGYLELLSFESLETIAGWKKEIADGRNPRDVKVLFAREIVTRFHNAQAAERAQADFEARHREGAMPENMPEVTVQTHGKQMPIAQ